MHIASAPILAVALGLALSAAVSATSSCRNAAVTEGAGSVSEGSGVAEWGPRAATARARRPVLARTRAASLACLRPRLMTR